MILTSTFEILLQHFSELNIGIAGLLLLLCLGLWMTWKPRPAPKGTNSVTKFVLAMRGLAAASAIGVAVYLSSLGYPIIAGLAAVFPAIFLTTMVALWIAQGADVPTGAAGPMMLGGSSVSVYSLIAPFALPAYGLILGSIVCWFGAVISTSIPAYWWLSKRNDAR